MRQSYEPDLWQVNSYRWFSNEETKQDTQKWQIAYAGKEKAAKTYHNDNLWFLLINTDSGHYLTHCGMLSLTAERLLNTEKANRYMFPR